MRPEQGQITTGLRAVLSLPSAYDFVQRALGANRVRRELVRRYLPPAGAKRVRLLDVGCGTAEILNFLPPTEYVGVDLSAAYISAAKARHGDRGTFLVQDVADPGFLAGQRPFDVTIMMGLLHHLPDASVKSLLSAVASVLAPSGVVITVDPTIAGDTRPFGRLLAQRDRGQHVRPPAGYEALAGSVFQRVTAHVRHDLLRVPYSHTILVCERG